MILKEKAHSHHHVQGQNQGQSQGLVHVHPHDQGLSHLQVKKMALHEMMKMVTTERKMHCR